MAAKHIKYQLQAFGRLRELQTQGILCDLVLMSRDQTEFKVHASVMVAACEPFYGLLCERRSLNKIRLNNIGGHSLGLLIRFIYGESFQNQDDIQILTETLMKLGMKHLNQFVETSCNEGIGILDEIICESSKGKTTSPSGIFTDSYSSEVNCGNSKSKFQGDNCSGNLLLKVKSEPLSPTKHVSSEGTGLENLETETIKVKTEPIDTSYEENSSICGTALYRNEDAPKAEGSYFATDTCKEDLKPMKLYVNETHDKNNQKNTDKNRPGNSLAEKSGILQEISDLRCLATEHVDCDKGFHGIKSAHDANSMGCLQTGESIQKTTCADSQDHQATRDSLLLHKNKIESVESKRVQVLLRQIDDQGNYAIFPVSPRDGAVPLVLDAQTKISEDQIRPTAENTDIMSQKIDMLNEDVAKESSPLVKLPVNTVPVLSPSAQPVMVNQPQIASGHKIIISPNGQIIAIPAAKLNPSRFSPAGTPYTPVKKSKRKGRQKVTWSGKQGKIREIIPKTELQIQNVVSLKDRVLDSTKVSEPSQDCASKRMRDYFHKCQALDHADSEEKTEGCQEAGNQGGQQSRAHGDEQTENSNKKQTVCCQMDSAKRKSGDSGDFQTDSLAKKAKVLNRLDDDDEDDEEYVVIDLEDMGDHAPEGKMTSLNVSGDDGDDIFTASGIGSNNETCISSSENNSSDMISVSDCTLQELSLREIPFGLVFPSKTKRKIYTGRKLNIFHSEEEAPQRKQKFVTKKTPKKQSKIMSVKSKCPDTQSQVPHCTIQPVARSLALSEVAGSTNPIKTIPIVVALANGKTATVMVPGYTPDNKLEVPLTPQVAAAPQDRQPHPIQTTTFTHPIQTTTFTHPKQTNTFAHPIQTTTFTHPIQTTTFTHPIQTTTFTHPKQTNTFTNSLIQTPRIRMASVSNPSNNVFTSSALTPSPVPGMQQIKLLQHPVPRGFVPQIISGAPTLSNSLPIGVSGSHQVGGVQSILQGPVITGSAVVTGGIQQQLLVPNFAIQNQTVSVPNQYLGQQQQMRLPTIPPHLNNGKVKNVPWQLPPVSKRKLSIVKPSTLKEIRPK